MKIKIDQLKRIKFKRVFTLLVCIFVLVLSIRYVISEKAQATIKKEPEINSDRKYPTVEIQTLIKDQTHGGYSVSYPSLHIKKIDQSLKTYVKKEIANYQQTLAQNAISKNISTELTITYDITHYSEQTVTILFNKYIFTGGKWGEPSIQTFTFDLPSKKQISLQDIFYENSDYLNSLSMIAFTELKQNKNLTELEQLKEKTKPSIENFSEFSLLENTIVLYFQPFLKPTGYSEPQSIAIKKEIFDSILLDQYKNTEANKNKIKETPPSHIVTEIPNSSGIDPTKKVIALTFDDGPSKGPTTLILDALKESDSHATFFVLGSRVQYYPEIIQRMLEEGNEVGNHSWDHPQLSRLTEEQVQHQILDTQAIIKKVSGHEPIHLRPPYGAINDNVRQYLGGGLSVTLWNVDTEDWKSRDKDQIVQSVMSKVADGKIVLMHDIYATSAEAAIEIIKQLKAQDYQLVTISELEEVKKQRQEA
ncbi:MULTISPECIES: polysaccharide deacetylase family protein [Bacillaceae]|uniref:Peptidoglycan/xylan/chitin deacetylase (PgdA/CDA1 family) n=1 Tax=Peribacillus huizhouensis TaxID=1501239 RepID=A0ABR6CSX7_9BACI|nr:MULTISPECIES: polysaccharide deacetylase family protein [Bacillaceae]MBA9028016.1 peptidoglycan/xylan/chitin deacetylase (PgdA/CDA1 family) [Peribacillus huizhouensis]